VYPCDAVELSAPLRASMAKGGHCLACPLEVLAGIVNKLTHPQQPAWLVRALQAGC